MSDQRSTIDLDWNENPLGTPASATEAVLAGARELHRYPRGLADEVRRAVAADAGVAPEQVLLTAGVDEALDLVLAGVTTMGWFTPGFPGYTQRAESLGVAASTFTLTANGDARWDPPAVGGWLDGLDLLVLTQPHLPTGRFFDDRWLDAALDRAALVFVDETYLEFSGRASFVEQLPDRPNLCVFRSCSKSFGLAGLRVGILVTDAARAADLEERYRWFPVDSLALRTVRAVLADQAFRAQSVDHVARWMPRYVEALSSYPDLLDPVVDTAANYVLARCPSAPTGALVGALAGAGIRVADCATFGLPGWIRVGVGTGGHLDALTAALDAFGPTVDTAAPTPAAAGSA